MKNRPLYKLTDSSNVGGLENASYNINIRGLLAKKQMQTGNRIPRWMIEDNPTWERLFDSNVSVLRWSKRGADIQAICSATSTFCEILHPGESLDSNEISLNISIQDRYNVIHPGGDIKKYLSSRYLNPRLGSIGGFGIANKYNSSIDPNTRRRFSRDTIY